MVQVPSCTFLLTSPPPPSLQLQNGHEYAVYGYKASLGCNCLPYPASVSCLGSGRPAHTPSFPAGAEGQAAASSTSLAGMPPTPLGEQRRGLGGAPGLLAQGGARAPLVVSLSLMRKEPTLLIGASSCLSASFRLIDLKNHLEKGKSRQTSERGRAPQNVLIQTSLPPKKQNTWSRSQVNPALMPTRLDT